MAPRKTSVRLALAAVGGVALLTGFTSSEPPPTQRPLRVLFIGNSLTATNNLPAFVAALARTAKHAKVEYRTFAPGAASASRTTGRSGALAARSPRSAGTRS